MSHISVILLRAALLVAWCAPGAIAQAQTTGILSRTFKAGDIQRYRVELTIRSEVTGHRPRQVADHTYAEPFSQQTQTTVTWQAVRRIVSVSEDGTAAIEETLDSFSQSPKPTDGRAGSSEETGAELEKTLLESLAAWMSKGTLALQYRESKMGVMTALPQQAAPLLDEAPPVVTLWLRRALRPTVALPNRVAREGERWVEPRAVRLPPWTEVQGTETLEWLDGPTPELSSIKFINLHVVQQIAGSVPSSEQDASLTAGQAHFHAESLNAVVHLGMPLYGGYGALYSATRSASREISHVVDTVPNLNEPAVFRARLSVEVRISVIE